MTTKKIIDKYDILFNSCKEFTFRVQLCNRGETEGATDEEIQSFCNDHNIILPAVLWSYTRHFGKKARARNTDYNCAYSLADYSYALHQASLREEWHDMMNVRELLKTRNLMVNYDDDYLSDNDGIYTPPINTLVDVDSIVPFHYDEFTRGFEFVDGSQENPYIFYLTRYRTLTSLFTSFSNNFRDILFLFIVNSSPYNYADMGVVDGKMVPIGMPPTIDYSDGFECIKAYQDMFQEKIIKRGILKSLREKFYIMNDEVEEKENRILSFTEFENKFIHFLKDY